MTRVATLLPAMAVAACFNPKLGDAPFLCGASDPVCPPGYTCVAGRCTRPGAPPRDAGSDARDAGSDARDAGSDARDAADAGDGGETCLPGTITGCLDDHTAVLCDGGERECSFRCDADAKLCEQCDPARPKQCRGSSLLECTAAGEIGNTTTCDSLCLASGDGARCAVLEPSNLPSDTCDNAAERPRAITADVSIDTDSCTGGTLVPQGNGYPTICLLRYTDFSISAAAVVAAVGSNALAIAADTIEIDGYLDVGALSELDGPGATTQGTGASRDADLAAGGGGAGYGTAGGRGGTEDNLVYVAGGPAYDGAAIVPLAGGSRGAASGGPPAPCTVQTCQAAGGGGGGALELVGCRSVTIGLVARIVAVGGGGHGGIVPGGGGGGGGSGGAILIEAPLVDVNEFAVLAATGGGGGGGAGLVQAGGGGADGTYDQAALGGNRGESYAGRGGTGGTIDAAFVTGSFPTDGEPTQDMMTGYGAGGGGGAAGRIRVNSQPDQPPTAGLYLPYPSLGPVAGH